MSDPRAYQTRCRGPHAKLLAYHDKHFRLVHIVCTSHYCGVSAQVLYEATDTPQQVADATLAAALGQFGAAYGIDDSMLAAIKQEVGGQKTSD